MYSTSINAIISAAHSLVGNRRSRALLRAASRYRWPNYTRADMRVCEVFTRAFAPQSMFVYACGFLIFALAPYLLLQKSIPAQRPWIEISLVAARLGLTALLILLGWALTLRALSILTVAEKS